MSQLNSNHHHRHQHHHSSSQTAHRGPSTNGASSKQAASASTAATAANTSSSGTGKRCHQRRQSVARLLPDISKLRLLSWLVEASSELINCDIAIMDGVYAKLNRSRESLLFWHPPVSNTNQPPFRQRPTRPAPPARQPIPNRLVLQQRPLNAARPSQDDQHHSLPVAGASYASNADAATTSSSLLLLGSSSSARPAGKATTLPQAPQTSNSGTCDTSPTTNEGKNRLCDSNQPVASNLDHKTPQDDHLELVTSNQEEEDDSSSASSGIHANSLSSSVSSSGSISSSGASSISPDQPQTTSLPPQVPPPPQRRAVSSAEELREKIIRTVMEHQHLQNLLVNIIRHHDKRRQQLQLQRRRQMSLDLYPGSTESDTSACHSQASLQRIDLADIADALDDGCLCTCHSVHQQPRCSDRRALQSPASERGNSGDVRKERSSTLPPSSSNLSQQVAMGSSFAISSPIRSKTVGRGSSSSAQKKGSRGGESQQLSIAGSNRQDIINLMSDRLCENCFETHHWLHGCLLDNASNLTTGTPTASSGSGKSSRSATVNDTYSLQAANQTHLNAIISNRNAKFIKLVQQQVRATISKSIELIDLIRKEIKLPESIKQKQLMRCFSASIQLLTSVGNYVVPAQDISTFLPEVGGHNHQQQTNNLFILPPSDFDSVLYLQQLTQHSPSFPMHQSGHQQHHLAFSQAAASGQLHYHLAAAPEIPLRRAIRLDLISASCAPVKESPSASNRNDTQLEASGHTPLSTAVAVDQVAPLNTPQKLKTHDELKQTGCSANESSSGASSNNSSASSSIARGAVQQSSLSRGAEAVQHSKGSDSPASNKTSHGLSFDTMASLSRQPQPLPHQQTTGNDEDLLFLQQQASRSSKFWQSSKFNFIKKLLHVRQQRLLRQQSKDRKIYNNKVQNKFRLVMMDLTHFNKSQQLLATENGVNSLLTSMRNVLEFGLYLTLKLY